MRVAANVMVRDMDVELPNSGDSRRIEGLCSEGSSSRLTPHWSHLSTQMAQVAQALPRTMVWHSGLRDAERSEGTQSFSGHNTTDAVWWCWRAKLVGAGPTRFALSSDLWRDSEHG